MDSKYENLFIFSFLFFHLFSEKEKLSWTRTTSRSCRIQRETFLSLKKCRKKSETSRTFTLLYDLYNKSWVWKRRRKNFFQPSEKTQICFCFILCSVDVLSTLLCFLQVQHIITESLWRRKLFSVMWNEIICELSYPTSEWLRWLERQWARREVFEWLRQIENIRSKQIPAHRQRWWNMRKSYSIRTNDEDEDDISDSTTRPWFKTS